jgi:hypothetical protein
VIQRRRSALKKLLNGFVGIALFSISVFFVAIVVHLISSEVSPAFKTGSLNVESSTMILNHVWEGNEIYVLLAAYILLACAFAYGAIRIVRKAINR